MNKALKFGKLFKAFLCIALLICIMLSCFSGCNEKSEIVKSANSQTDRVSESAKKCTEYTLIGTYEDSSELINGIFHQEIEENEVKYGKQMERIMATYGEQDVLLHYVVFFKLVNRESPLKGKDVEKFAKDIGALKIYEGNDVITLPVGGYGIIGTPQSVRNIEKMGYTSCFIQMMKLETSRPDGYSNVISDSLATMIDNMEDDEKIEVVVTTVISYRVWVYRYSHMPSSNRGRGKSFENFNKLKISNKELSYDECVQLAEQFTNNVAQRNNITQEKLLDGKVIAEVSGTKEDFAVPGSYGKPQDHIFSGFAAKLTKAEILALAEDEDIQIIHNDTVISTYTVYE